MKYLSNLVDDDFCPQVEAIWHLDCVKHDNCVHKYIYSDYIFYRCILHVLHKYIQLNRVFLE